MNVTRLSVSRTRLSSAELAGARAARSDPSHSADTAGPTACREGISAVKHWSAAFPGCASDAIRDRLGAPQRLTVGHRPAPDFRTAYGAGGDGGTQ